MKPVADGPSGVAGLTPPIPVGEAIQKPLEGGTRGCKFGANRRAVGGLPPERSALALLASLQSAIPADGAGLGGVDAAPPAIPDDWRNGSASATTPSRLTCGTPTRASGAQPHSGSGALLQQHPLADAGGSRRAGGESGAAWQVIMAGTLLTAFPLLLGFLVFQRRFINGFIQSGLRWK